MELPGIFNYDIIFALFLGFFVLLGAHKGFEKMLKLVLIFIIPIVVLYYFGTTIHKYIPSLEIFNQVVVSIGNIIPALLPHTEVVKYLFIETILYLVMTLILAAIASMIKIKAKKSLLEIKMVLWKKVVGAVLSVVLFYVFSFYMIYPLQLIGINYHNSYVVEPMVQNGLDVINVAPLLKHKDKVIHDYVSFTEVESSLLGNEAKHAYQEIVKIQNDIFTFEMRFMDIVYPALRTNARDALLANKTFVDPLNPHRGFASALIVEQGTLLYYDILIALEQESTSIAIVRSEYDTVLKYRSMISFFYDILNGEILLDYEDMTDASIKNVLDSYVTYFEDNMTNNVAFQLILIQIYDRITAYYLYGNLMGCAVNELTSCALSITPIVDTPKVYQTQMRQDITNHINIDRIIAYAVDGFQPDALTTLGLSNQHISKLLKQKESFVRYTTFYKESVDGNEYNISFANKVMMAMMNNIKYKELLLRSNLLRAYMNDLGSNYQNKLQITDNIYISSETFNMNMALIDIIFHTEIWDGTQQLNVGDMERLIDKVQYYVNNKIITQSYAQELMNHLVFGQDNYHQSYLIDIIEANQVSNAALNYFINSSATFISQELKDQIASYLP
ncbi:MAG TPA: hypothetical protein PLR26_00575 [Bacilli bacterium]|nr:hypothetical protein [Bacilli bacterium]